MIPSWAVVGAKVVCVDSFLQSCSEGEIMPNRGQVLTIRHIRSCEGTFSPAFLLFNEIHNIHRQYSDGYLECDWGSEGFRPATIAETDMEIFRKIASNLPTAKELEPVVDHALERLNQ